MHDIKYIRNDVQGFKNFLKKRFLDTDVDKILKLDENNRKYSTKRRIRKRKKRYFKIKR
jgi:seryl-tRNA synthetase